MNQFIFDDILATFTRIFIDGFLNIHASVMLWLGVLLMGMLVISLFLALRFADHPFVLVVLGIIWFRAFVLVSIAQNWDTITSGFLNAVVRYGLIIGGSIMTPEEFLSPGRLFFLGAALSQNLLLILTEMGSDWWLAPVLFFAYWIGMQVLWAVFAMMAITVMLAAIEFRLLVVYGFLMWPLMTAGFLSIIAETVAFQVLYAALRLAALATFIGTSLNYAVQVGIPAGETTVTGAMCLTFGMIAMLFIVWMGPRIFGAQAWPGSGLVKVGLLTWFGAKKASA
jgi:TrbL/VirB6 plasmid conjugal transfer protein